MIDKIINGADSIIGKFVPDKTKAEEFKKQLEIAILKDKDSARDLHKLRLLSNDTFVRRFVPFLAIGIIMMCIMTLITLFFVQIPEKNRDLIIFAISTLFSGGFGSIIGFYFGSSDSKR